MPIPNIRTVTAYHVSHFDLEKAINAFYGTTDFEVGPDLESSNDTTHEFHIEAEPVDEYDSKKVAAMKAGKIPEYATQVLMQDMCAAGDIPPGRYFVRVCW